jgi:hypothetical protein
MKTQKKRNTKSFKKQLKKKSTPTPKRTLFDLYTSQYRIDYGMIKEINKLRIKSEKFVNNSTISNKTELRYIISTNNIPNEIRNDVKNLMLVKKPKRGQCLLYSKFISSQIPEINQIYGLFHKNEFQVLSKILPKNQLVDMFDSIFFKDNNEKVWGLHSWNEYKGVHFDCLKDTIFDFDKEKEFIKYIIFKKDEEKINPELAKYFNCNYEFISSSMI